uniref:Uncharacterized protein n=1 Tax=Glossina pallidipes TaxID=7398 RepID=A0A1A9ZN48_GLOPL
MVLTSDISSNALLINPDGSTQTCGLGGFLSAMRAAVGVYIARRAIKIIFDEYIHIPIEGIWDLNKEYFKIENREELVVHLYQNFDKSVIGPLCAKLAEAAEKGNRLAQYLFREAGEDLGTMAAALVPKIQPGTLKSNTLNIVGSVGRICRCLKKDFVRVFKRPPYTLRYQFTPS